MQSGLSVMREFRIDVDPCLQQEIDDAGSPEFTSPGKSIGPLLLAWPAA